MKKSEGNAMKKDFWKLIGQVVAGFISIVSITLLIMFMFGGTHTTSGIVTQRAIYGGSHNIYFGNYAYELNTGVPYRIEVLPKNYNKYEVGNWVEMRYLFGKYWVTGIEENIEND